MKTWATLASLSLCLLSACSAGPKPYQNQQFENRAEGIPPTPTSSISTRQTNDTPHLSSTAPSAYSIPEHITRIARQSPAVQPPAEQPPANQPPAAQPETSQPEQSSPAKVKAKSAVTVKGIYVPAWKAKGASLSKLIGLLDRTELNAMVIDVKNDSGQITYDSNVGLANEIGADDTKPIPDIKALLTELKGHQIYTIARVVAFKDPYLCSVRKDLAMHTKAGAVWRDRKGVAWVDPYHPDVQAYNIAIAKEAIELGFDEVQFDYVRFPENGQKVDQEVKFYNPQGLNKSDVIQQFLTKAKQAIPAGAISADVFGLTTSAKGDMGIGQDWGKMSPAIDYISPMVYPSHYSSGTLGVRNPDLNPYDIIKVSMQDALEKNQQLEASGKKAAQVRPWLQDFTAKWVKPHQTYGAKQVKEQIRAAKELGIDQYLLWNPSCNYSYRD
ncbi:putative glycoside hydrolase [Paenibacillus chartarius]|uniref:Glycoside hydrolase n=1 Tax=Paenibacillus chartarius TaxID=747481 RepID=A0ABV6DUN6_9BACL